MNNIKLLVSSLLILIFTFGSLNEDLSVLAYNSDRIEVPDLPGAHGIDSNIPDLPGAHGTDSNIPDLPGAHGTDLYTIVT